MSLLTGPEIRRYAEGEIGPRGERIVITPFDPQFCGPNSYDVHLGDMLLEYCTDNWNSGVHRHTSIDPLDPPQTRVIPLSCAKTDPCWLLRPGRVYLASTKEYTETHGFAPKLEGRSSIARLGLAVHITAGFGDDGFKGNFTLELVATQPILIRPGMRIAQIAYHTLTGERQPYKGRYCNQGPEPVASRFNQEARS